MRFFALGLVAYLSWTMAASAQAPKVKAAEPAATDDTATVVEFETADDVRLTGTYYRGIKGSESPCAILLHRLKSDRTKGGWDALAKELQNKLGFAVLTFDFRGHGASTRVKEKFWNYDHNKNGLRGGLSARGKSTIAFSEFKNSYWPILANDIAAARYFLDQQNDASRCNTSTIVVIGAEDGAGLGMLWMAHENDRRPIPNNIFAVQPNAKTPGEDLAAGVWLGPSRGNLAGLRTSEWFGRASALRGNTAMYFIYGKQDPASAPLVPSMLAAIKRTPDNIKTKHSYDREEALNTKLPGQDLIGPTAATLNVNDKIVKYLEQIATNFRKNVAWREMKSTMPQLFPISTFGYNPPG